MKVYFFRKAGLFIAFLLLLIVPLPASAEYPQAAPGAPPVEQPLVREGTLAMKLAPALGLPNPSSEAEAESILGEIGVMPRNGWVSDYPVTPDIIGELRDSVGDSADEGKIPFSREEAVRRFDEVTAEFDINIRPQEEDAVIVNGEEENYGIPPAEINDYYYGAGPPVVTYYTPPQGFYYLYSWVPYPFWCGGFWFGGFYVLKDFHRPVYAGHHRHRAYVSNYYRGSRGVTRIDPVSRYYGRSGGSRYRWPDGRPTVGSVPANRFNSAPVIIRGNTTSNFSSYRYRPVSGRSGLSGNRQTTPLIRSSGGGTFAPSSRSDSPAVRTGRYIRGNAPSRTYGTPVRVYAPPARVSAPARGTVSFHGSNSPSHSSAPAISGNSPVRSIGSSRTLAPSGGSTRSFGGSATSGSGFRGGGGFTGGYGRR